MVLLKILNLEHQRKGSPSPLLHQCTSSNFNLSKLEKSLNHNWNFHHGHMVDLVSMAKSLSVSPAQDVVRNCKDFLSCTCCLYFCSNEIIWKKSNMGFSDTWLLADMAIFYTMMGHHSSTILTRCKPQGWEHLCPNPYVISSRDWKGQPHLEEEKWNGLWFFFTFKIGCLIWKWVPYSLPGTTDPWVKQLCTNIEVDRTQIQWLIIVELGGGVWAATTLLYVNGRWYRGHAGLHLL